VLTRPESCPLLGVVGDPKHPSHRQSLLDWGDLAQAKSNHFDEVPAIETVMHAGEVLYIPSYWFHYIVSLDNSIQCNTRNGRPDDATKGRGRHRQVPDCSRVNPARALFNKTLHTATAMPLGQISNT
jgi:hypothetical protein